MNITLFPIWKNKTVVCMASGPSLRFYQTMVTGQWKVIAVNDAYKLAPWADILYACDRQWWEWHSGCPEFKGYKLQHRHREEDKPHSTRLEPYPGIDCIVSDGTSGFSNTMDTIRTGGNSGYQALHMAIQLGAARIILLGYDMKPQVDKSHFFGEHPNGRGADYRYEKWIKEFPALQTEAVNRGIKIYNCSPDSALECFEKIDIDELI
jgi:hypothetical protein